MDAKKAADAKLIAAAFKRLKEVGGSDLFESCLPGWADGRRTGWTTAEVLAAIEAAMAKARLPN